MVNTEIRLIIFFAAKDGEALYSQQKQDWELTVAQIMNSLLLKLQYFGHLMRRTDSLEKDFDAGRDWEQEEKGMTEDEMAGWHH